MPYEISFVKPVTPPADAAYFNQCCFGGDVVSDRLLPPIQRRYTGIMANQEDWGWFIWFRDGSVRLGIDIFCDDPQSGSFRIHLTSSKKRFLLGREVVDLPELDVLKQLVESELTEWTGGPVRSQQIRPD